MRLFRRRVIVTNNGGKREIMKSKSDGEGWRQIVEKNDKVENVMVDAKKKKTHCNNVYPIRFVYLMLNNGIMTHFYIHLI